MVLVYAVFYLTVPKRTSPDFRDASITFNDETEWTIRRHQPTLLVRSLRSGARGCGM
jgi:hypothetical protein